MIMHTACPFPATAANMVPENQSQQASSCKTTASGHCVLAQQLPAPSEMPTCGHKHSLCPSEMCSDAMNTTRLINAAPSTDSCDATAGTLLVMLCAGENCPGDFTAKHEKAQTSLLEVMAQQQQPELQPQQQQQDLQSALSCMHHLG
jgi:hypothetical protein